jgi:S-adenosylmethionine uptake transporter
MRAPPPILLVSLGVFFGCIVDALIKSVTEITPVLTATAWRFILAAIFMSALFVALRKPFPAWPAIRFHAGRSLAQVSSAVAFFYGLTQLALAEAVVLGFTAALMIAPIARIILRERMSKIAIIASLIGFAGAAFAMSDVTTGGPENGNRLLGTIAVVFSALGYALCIVLLRMRTAEEDSLTLVTFMNVLPALFLLPFLIATEPLPPAEAWPTLFVLATAGIGIWWMMTLAYARALAQQLAPFEFTALIWSALIGYFFFSEQPGPRLFIGAGVIIGACLLVAYDAHRTARRAALPPGDIIT